MIGGVSNVEISGDNSYFKKSYPFVLFLGFFDCHFWINLKNLIRVKIKVTGASPHQTVNLLFRRQNRISFFNFFYLKASIILDFRFLIDKLYHIFIEQKYNHTSV